MGKLASVNLTDVARAAGLSTGGVSYALRGHPSIPAATVERVRRVAVELGYRPDLRIRSLMATIRRGRPLAERETLALVWVNTPRKLAKLPLHLQQFAQSILQGASQRAGQLGCAIDQFWLDDYEMRPERLRKILLARGISGVIVAPAGSEEAIAIDWDWSAFAGTIIGSTDCTPVLNRSAHYHYRSVWMTLERLRGEGCVRPAAILSRAVQERIHSMQLAAFLTNHPTPKSADGLVRFSQPGDLDSLGPWLRKAAPDALVVAWQIDRRTATLLRKLAPRTQRMVTLDWHPRGVLPGVDPCNAALAANAVDLVVAQLHRNELGIPARPSTLLLDGVWSEP
jgi:LacI family transcriptional regulator